MPGVAAVQVLVALWMYRKLPLAGTPRRLVRSAHTAPPESALWFYQGDQLPQL